MDFTFNQRRDKIYVWEIAVVVKIGRLAYEGKRETPSLDLF